MYLVCDRATSLCFDIRCDFLLMSSESHPIDFLVTGFPTNDLLIQLFFLTSITLVFHFLFLSILTETKIIILMSSLISEALLLSLILNYVQFSSVQSLSCVQLFATP